MSMDEVDREIAEMIRETRAAERTRASRVAQAIVTLAEAWQKGGPGPNELLHEILAERRRLGETPQGWIDLVRDAQAFLWELG